MKLYCLVSVAVVFLASALAAQGNLGPTLQNLKDRNGTTYYTILKSGEDWTGGPWDDPTEADRRFLIGKVEKTILPDEEYKYQADWTVPDRPRTGQWAGDYFACYVAPAGRSDLSGHLFCKEALNDYDPFLQGTGNRHNDEGWGVSAKPNASSTDPLVVGESEQYWHKYIPQPLDEQSIIEVTWQQKIHMRAAIVHKSPDAEQDEFVWLRPVVEAIDGSEIYFRIELSNGTVRSETTSIGASLEAGTDGVSAAINWGQATTYTNYDSLTASALITDDSPEVLVVYSVQAPDPGVALITRTKFEWAAYIDDNNTPFTAGFTYDKSTLDYSARIQSSVRPKKIVLVQGTQGKPYGRDLPGFVAPAFRNFDNDANLMEAAYSQAIAAVRSTFGL